MTQIYPFRPYLVTPTEIANVAAPPYDSMSVQQRAAFGVDHPNNFINAMRSIEEFPDDQRPSLDQVLQQNSDALERLLREGFFALEPEHSYFVYQLQVNDHVQTGVVAEVPLAEFQAGLIRQHEDTRSGHEDRLFDYLGVVGANSSPICAAYPTDPEIDDIVAGITADSPWLDYTDDLEVCQRIWRVSDAKIQSALEECFERIAVLYLTDGHHRIASAARHAKIRNLQKDVDGPWNYLLMDLLPAEQLQILPFNRCVYDLGDLSEQAFLKSLSEVFSLEPWDIDGPGFRGPRSRGEFVLLLGGEGYRLAIDPKQVPDHPVDGLDVSILQNLVLEPLLGIHDPRADPRLEYVTGESGMEGLRQQWQLGWQLVFACYPPSLEQLMAVADADLRMPPKSTCFDPKARPGIFVRRC